MEHLYTVEQAADMLHVHPKTLRKWLREKRIKGTRAGRGWRIRESDLEAFLKADVEDDPLAAINEALEGTDRQ